MTYGINDKKQKVEVSEKTDTVTKTECPAYIIESYINGTSGYRIWSDGTCEQWGKASFNANGLNATISLLLSYVDENSYVVIGSKTVGDTESVGFNIQPYTKNSFKVGVAYSSALPRAVQWYAVGKLAEGEY